MEVMNKLLKLVEVGESLGETELRLVFDKAIVDSDLVSGRAIAFNYCLTRL